MEKAARVPAKATDAGDEGVGQGGEHAQADDRYGVAEEAGKRHREGTRRPAHHPGHPWPPVQTVRTGHRCALTRPGLRRQARRAALVVARAPQHRHPATPPSASRDHTRSANGCSWLPACCWHHPTPPPPGLSHHNRCPVGTGPAAPARRSARTATAWLPPAAPTVARPVWTHASGLVSRTSRCRLVAPGHLPP